MKNVVDTVMQIGKFKKLIQSIRETGLIDTLSVDGPFTIFAPTDEAFTKIQNGVLDDLLINKERLTEILTYHVIPKKIMADSLKELSTIQTANGEKISINSSSYMKINDVRVIEMDILCSNGVIHVIDSVLIPK
jgi:uncharacterized surface protein with fasciclin (FAS1) repeats